MMTGLRLNVFVLVVGLVALRASAQVPEVTLPGTPTTTIRGIYVPYNETEFLNVEMTFEAFLGIPFAEPPTGDLRFKNPVKKGNLSPTYLANRDRSVCPQLATLGLNENEDCLFLGVFSASPRPTNAPVLVWIHGGAYTLGSGSQGGYKPYPLIAVAPEIVVVTINYRLGVFGFLTTGDSAAPGNYGMLDQVVALQWVQDNIAAFGGDPTKVTIMGESAGAASVGLHLLSPLSDGLFSQAIMESGNAFCPWAADTNIDRQIGFTEDIAGLVNCTSSNNEAMMDCLRTVDEDALVVAQQVIVVQNLVIELVFVPVVDNYFLPDVPIEILKREEFHKVPTLLGTNLDEGTLIVLRVFPEVLVSPDDPTMTIAQFREFLPSYLYYSTPLLVSAVEQWYIDWTQADNSSADQLPQFIDLQTDQVFACATELMARAMEDTSFPVYRYEFTHRPPGGSWVGAGHGSEIEYVFAYALNPGISGRAGQTDEEIVMSVQFLRYWTNFVRTGNPNTPLTSGEYPDWPRYTLPEQEYKVLSLPMENGRAMRMEKCAFWLNYAPTLYKLDDPEDVYQDWQQEYEQWRDVSMKEWNEAFEEYKNNDGCTTP